MYMRFVLFVIVFKSDRIIWPSILCSSTTSIYSPSLIDICGTMSYFTRGLKIIAFVLIGLRSIFLSVLYCTIESTSPCSVLYCCGRICRYSMMGTDSPLTIYMMLNCSTAFKELAALLNFYFHVLSLIKN